MESTIWNWSVVFVWALGRGSIKVGVQLLDFLPQDNSAIFQKASSQLQITIHLTSFKVPFKHRNMPMTYIPRGPDAASMPVRGDGFTVEGVFELVGHHEHAASPRMSMPV